MVGSDVFLCYKRTMMRPDFISYKPGLLDRSPPVCVCDNVSCLCPGIR